MRTLRWEDEAPLAQVLPPNHICLSPLWTRSFAVDPKTPQSHKIVLSRTPPVPVNHYCFKVKNCFTKKYPAGPDYGLMELEFNVGPNRQKDEVTQCVEIKPCCCCLSITAQRISAGKKGPAFAQLPQQNPSLDSLQR